MSRMGRFGSPRLQSRLGRSTLLLGIESLESRWCPAVPAFSSLPGANHTIYLDFDGHVTQNTQWNNYFNNPTINSPAYDTDSNPSTYSASELADIEDVWKRISEDYFPFQVNVTTVDPGIEALRKSGTGDTQWGIRAVITADTEGSGAGGIGYIDSFNWSSDTPVFVYVTGGKNVAEAASHEVGHSLGLAHDGTSSSSYYTGHGSGETSWAPLMGVGYYTNVTQWDRGEYYNANNVGSGANYSKGPDDLAIITSYNGFGYRADDYGNSISSASPLTVSGNDVSGSGFIGTTNDVDYFSFTTAGGQATLNINPYTPGPNLDVKADLFDASGNLVATSNSASTLSASFSLNLAAGQYFLKIDGTGFGNPGSNPPNGYTDYATLGRYFISGTMVSAPQMPQLSINDVSVNENAGTVTFTVSLSGTLSGTATVNYSTSNGSALTPQDYQSASGTLTFTAGGPTTQSVTVAITDDNVTESTENFFVDLSNAAGATLGDAQSQGTIVDNDVSPTLSITATDAIKPEGTSSTSTPYTFTVTRAGDTNGSASVNWSVAGIGGGKNAASANDFAGGSMPSGTITFAAGESSKTITIQVSADSTKEGNENFRVTLSNPQGATLATATADGQLVNDDGPRPNRTLSPDLFPLPGADVSDHHDQDHSGGSTRQNDRWQQVLQALVNRSNQRSTDVGQTVASRLGNLTDGVLGLPALGVDKPQFETVPPRAKTTTDKLESLAQKVIANANQETQARVSDALFMNLGLNRS